MIDNNRYKTVINKRDMIKLVARETKIKIPIVKEVFEGIERGIMRELCQRVDINNDVDINLFNGIKIEGRYQKPRYKKTGIVQSGGMYISDKVGVKVTVSRRFKENLNNFAPIGN